MKHLMVAAMLCVAACTNISTNMSEPAILEARFTPVPGANVEYAQGAIERCEALHRPLSPVVWVIVDADRASAANWERRLNETIKPGVGRFEVVDADAELRRRVAAGEIELQR